MQWLLDTCVISELPKLAPNKPLLTWLQANANEALISAVTLGEIQYGIHRLEVGRNRNRLQTWFDAISSQFGARTLHTDDAVWLTWARLKSEAEQLGRPQEDLDLLIAATAQAHSLTLVTRNVRHFKDTGIELLNPWML
jgi:toxin FitB